MTWDADTFTELIMEPDSIPDLLARLVALPEADRTSTRRAFGKALPELRRRLRTPEAYERLSLLAITLDCSVTQVLATFTPWSMPLLVRDEAACDYILPRFLARGRDWTGRFVAAVMKRRPIARVAVALVDPLVTAHELPLPTDAGYLEDWLKHCFLPRPGVRWTEQFLIACTAQNAFRFQTDFWADEARAGDVRARVAQLRDLGEFDDTTVSRALIQILERGDNRNAQRGALDWLFGLGLAPQLWEERARLIAALPSVQPNVLARVLDALIQPGTTPGELADIAVAVLPRQEKQPRRDVLRALSRVGSPTPELLETVRFITSGQDSVAAGLALSLLDGWGESRPETEVSGLWCTPSGPDPNPLPEFTDPALVLDDRTLAYVLTKVLSSYQDDEYILACSVATAHARGREVVTAAFENLGRFAFNTDAPLREALARFLGRPVNKSWRLARESRLSRLATARVLAALERLGELPCLLATPSHSAFRISWEVFADRARRYRDAGLELGAVDVAAALTRLDGPIPEDLTDLDQPIGEVGVSLAEVLAAWRDHPAPPTELAPPEDGSSFREARICGGEPLAFELLGLPPTDQRAEPATSWTNTEHPFALQLFPTFPTVPALQFLQVLTVAWERQGWWALRALQGFAGAARSFGSVPSLAVVGVCAQLPPDAWDEAAVLLIDAWNDGRLLPSDLVAAWRNPWRARLKTPPHRLVKTLNHVADTGGLALVWPLLVEVCEELAGMKQVPASALGLLEAVLHHLPEVRAAGVAVDLPNVTALATRKGNGKTVTVARRIVEISPVVHRTGQDLRTALEEIPPPDEKFIADVAGAVNFVTHERTDPREDAQF